MQAARALAGFINLEMRDSCQQIDETYEDLLNTETFQKGSRKTLIEGGFTTAVAFSLLSSQIVEGFEDPTTLFRSFIDDSVFRDFSLLIPFSETPRMGTDGYRFRDTVKSFKDGDVWRTRLSPELIHQLTVHKRKHLVIMKKAEPAHRNLGCPLGREVSLSDSTEAATGINEATDAFYPFLRHYYEIPYVRPRSIY
jgi:hypothetical protein